MTAAGARRGETGEWTARAHRGTFPGARRSLSGDEKAAVAVTPTAGRRLAREDPRVRCLGPVPAARAAEAKRARGFPEPAAGASSESGEALPGRKEQQAPGPRRMDGDGRERVPTRKKGQVGSACGRPGHRGETGEERVWPVEQVSSESGEALTGRREQRAPGPRPQEGDGRERVPAR